MQGGQRLWGLVIFVQLGCSGAVRDFEATSAGASAGGASAAGANANGGGTSGRSGTVGQSGASNGGDAGDGSPEMCTSALDCASRPHVRAGAPTACSAGKCSIPESSCESGFGHCSASDTEFCETDLTSAENCGACAKKCPSAAPLCMAGECVSSCTQTKPTTCSGTCVDTQSDPENCGACHVSCASPNADTQCSDGKCGLPVCKAGYGDCTSAPGCETRLNSLTNCGACGKTCGAANDAASCTTGTCVVGCKSSTEDCFNGKDDDCDALVDCADSDCTPTAMCAPAGNFTFGTKVDPAVTCPSSFQDTGTTLHGGLNEGSGCGGCGCNPTTTECGPYSLKMYYSGDSCSTQGTLVGDFTINQYTTTCTAQTISQAWNNMYFTKNPKYNCSNTGSATLAAASWTSNAKFCPTTVAGAGCSDGRVCVPIPPISACVMANGSQSCPSDFPKQQSLYEGFSDTRSCSCSCTATGGSCDPIGLKVSGSPSDCGNGFGSTGGGACSIAAAKTQLGYVFSGTATNPTACTPSNNLSGSVTTTGAHTMCCQ